MEKRKLGAAGLEVTAIGYGCMGLNHGYGPVPSKEESVKLIRQAVELGYNFFDTAEGYGAGKNEELLGEAIQSVRDQIVIATKFGGNSVKDGKLYPIELSPAEIRQHLEASLRRLQTDRIDLYYQHRVSKVHPVEEVALLMEELIREGKILGWGLSQATEGEIRRAHAQTPLTAIQSEYSMMERMFENDVISACEELGIGFVPFSPLAGGFLSAKINPEDTFTGDDVRKTITRYKPENVSANLPLKEFLLNFAQEKGVTPAQISLAWMLHKKPFIVPIPGTKHLNRLKENIGAVNVNLTDDDFNRLEVELSKIKVHGNRTDEDIILRK